MVGKVTQYTNYFSRLKPDILLFDDTAQMEVYLIREQRVMSHGVMIYITQVANCDWHPSGYIEYWLFCLDRFGLQHVKINFNIIYIFHQLN